VCAVRWTGRGSLDRRSLREKVIAFIYLAHGCVCSRDLGNDNRQSGKCSGLPHFISV
jgi:hypothetical protein